MSNSATQTHPGATKRDKYFFDKAFSDCPALAAKSPREVIPWDVESYCSRILRVYFPDGVVRLLLAERVARIEAKEARLLMEMVALEKRERRRGRRMPVGAK